MRLQSLLRLAHDRRDFFLLRLLCGAGFFFRLLAGDLLLLGEPDLIDRLPKFAHPLGIFFARDLARVEHRDQLFQLRALFRPDDALARHILERFRSGAYLGESARVLAIKLVPDQLDVANYPEKHGREQPRKRRGGNADEIDEAGSVALEDGNENGHDQKQQHAQNVQDVERYARGKKVLIAFFEHIFPFLRYISHLK